MGYLSLTGQWAYEVYQLETTDPVLGGPNGVSNRPHLDLANRTEWLKNEIEKLNDLATHTAHGLMSSGDKVKLDGLGTENAGAPVGDLAGLPLAEAGDAGVSSFAAREDHVHPYPTPAEIGAAGLLTNTFNGVQTFGKAVVEKYINLVGGNIDLSLGNWFGKVVTGTVSFTLGNIPESGQVGCFILELINGGAYIINWWPNLTWGDEHDRILTASGRDVLGFFTRDGGATWTGLMLRRDVK